MEAHVYLLICLSVLGVVFNGIAFYVYVRKTTTVPHIFIRMLALTDFLTCAITIPLCARVEYSFHSIDSELLCKMETFFKSSNIPFSAMMMVPIALDRFISICMPLSSGISKRTAFLIILALGSLSVAIATAFTVSTHVHVYSESDRNGTDAETSTDMLMKQNFSSNTNVTKKYRSFCSNLHFLPIGLFYFYASLFVISLLVTVTLYIMIYITLIRWQKKKLNVFAKYKTKSRSTPAPSDSSTSSAELQNDDGESKDMNINSEAKVEFGAKDAKSGRVITDSASHQSNVRLAIMLFSTSAVFTIFYLPAWLMSFVFWDLYIPFLFYMYFSYNVIHPITFVIMDQTIQATLWSKIRNVVCIARADPRMETRGLDSA